MNFCFTKSNSTLFTRFNIYQQEYLSHIKQIYEYCDNAVHNASVATQGTYEMEIKLPNDTGTATAKSVIVQWHGRPRRLVYNASNGPIHELPNPLLSIINNASLNNATGEFNRVKAEGGKFNQGGYPPLAVKIVSNKLVVVTPYDNRRYTPKEPRCNLHEDTERVDKTKECLNITTKKLFVTVIY